MRRFLGSLIAALLLFAGVPTVEKAEASAQTPSCAEGPVTVGGTTYGTPCGDLIVASPKVAVVRGGRGNDTIVAPLADLESCPAGCRLGVGSQTFEGGPGNDIVFGERGNDTLLGGEGNDQLYGGIGDDLLRGGPGNDLLAGGFGADSIDGESGDDYVRGDGTIDRIVDSGPATDDDTLSYATGITPGFPDNAAYPNFSEVPGFPGVGGERGVYLNLGAGVADNGVAPFGGGVDEVEGGDFEMVIGTPFSDYIVGSVAGQTIYGGGGADVILGEGGPDHLEGGADGDEVDGSGEVVQRNQSKISAGLMAPGATGYSQLYLTGSNAADEVTATYAPSAVTFTLGSASAGSFDTSPSASSGCGTPTSTQLVCPLSAPLDSIVIAGMGGNDTIQANGFPASAAVVIIGGEGSDSLTGGEESEDVLVDGPGSAADTLSALGRDDALLHNGGADHIFGGDGNDLFLSNSVCDGDELDGGAGRDNASWAKFISGVEVNLGTGEAGRPGVGGTPSCSSGSPDALRNIEDLEGSNSADTLYGDGGPNQLLGHDGADSYFSGAGEDTILANAADADAVIDCGADDDVAVVDLAQFGDPAPVECETVVEAKRDNFNLPPREIPPPAPTEAATPSPPAPPADTTPPRTRIVARPRKVSTIAGKGRRRVVFRFAASERGSSFRCKLDGGPFKACASPRAYLVGPGKHTVRIVAVDPTGNSDPSPALFGFNVRRR